ncbi:MAG: DUF1294 domain-containing protein [Clostridiales bacterium]|nr:DUF1294 domain-containing protein [Clostridiales bacterium]
MIGYILGYTVIVNIVSFITMYIDKKRAKEGKWRVKEKLLFTLAFL